MNRQDRNGVRTAQDLERKYNFAGIVKAVRLFEEGINKTNTTLEDFINVTLGSLDDLDILDGNITTYYYSGVPTITNLPASGWVEEDYEYHIGDFYYDKDTGYAYEFDRDEATGEYFWSEREDSLLIKALALANASSDTADSKRQIFTETPTPPYSNGDLWFTEEKEIFICQISKPTGEIYEENDFIIATKYTDDTVANKVGGDLEVLQGTVLEIINDADSFKVEVNEQITGNRAELELHAKMFASLIKGRDGESLMEQTEDGWSFNIKDILDTLQSNTDNISSLEEGAEKTNETVSGLDTAINGEKGILAKTSYISIGSVNGTPTIELGESDSDFKVVITNTAIEFKEGTSIPAYISNQALNINKAVIEDELQLGGFVWSERANGNMGLLWKGDDI